MLNLGDDVKMRMQHEAGCQEQAFGRADNLGRSPEHLFILLPEAAVNIAGVFVIPRLLQASCVCHRCVLR